MELSHALVAVLCTMLWFSPVLHVLHALPAACAAAHVQCHDEGIWLTVGRSETSPPNRMSASPAVCTAPSRARVCVRAPQSVFDFFLHLFTRVRQLLDSKKDRGEDFVRKRGDFLHFLGVSAQFSVDIQGSIVERSVNWSVTDDLMKSVKVNEIRELLFKRRYIIN